MSSEHKAPNPFLYVLMIMMFLSFLLSKAFGAEMTTLQLVKQYDSMTDVQKLTSKHICRKTSDFDLCYSSRAQAWEESLFNELSINPNDPSFGAFHKVVKSPKVAIKLVRSIDYSIDVYLEDIKRLREICGYNKYRCIYGSYNGGVTGYKKHLKTHNYKIDRYIKRIVRKIRALQIIDRRDNEK